MLGFPVGSLVHGVRNPLTIQVHSEGYVETYRKNSQGRPLAGISSAMLHLRIPADEDPKDRSAAKGAGHPQP